MCEACQPNERRESDKVPFFPEGRYCVDLVSGDRFLCAKKPDGAIWVVLDAMLKSVRGKFQLVKVAFATPVRVAESDFNEKYEVIDPEDYKEEGPE